MKSELKSFVIGFAVVFVFFAFVSRATAQTDAENQKVIADARQRYSLLRRQGMTELRASVTPNWERMLTEVPAAERQTALTFARRLKFTVAINAVAGTVDVTHSLVGPRPATVRMNALESIARGMDMSIKGFLMTWTPFMVTQVIPEKPEHLIFQNLENGYAISYREGGANVNVDFAKDLRIKELRTPGGAVRPEFLQTPQGFVLTGYEGDFELPDLGRLSLKVAITPGTDKLLPAKVLLLSTIGAGQNRVELVFSNYVLKGVGTGQGRKKIRE